MKHPAKFSDSILHKLDEILPHDCLILDPFAGVGRIKEIRPLCVLVEIEPEWASMCGAIVGDATNLPFLSHQFDVICTSPAYGNRMADNYIDKEPGKYVRHTYRYYLGRRLNPANSGCMQWGKRYQKLHERAYEECNRVLKPWGLFVLNMSDHIRKGKIVPVTIWHKECLESNGLILVEWFKIQTPRQKHGQNYNLRVDHENILVFIKPQTEEDR